MVFVIFVAFVPQPSAVTLPRAMRALPSERRATPAITKLTKFTKITKSSLWSS